MKKLSFRLLYPLFLLCTISLMMAPAPSYARRGFCDNTDFGRTTLIVGGSFLVGGLVGTAAGHLASQNHKHAHSGARGANGVVGLQGSQGLQGLPGTSGTPGTAGAPGIPGSIGPNVTGATGATGPAGDFVLDTGAILTFDYGTTNTLEVLGTPGSTVTITAIPYVDTPDNRVITGPSVSDTETLDAVTGLATFTFDFAGNSSFVDVEEVFIGQYQVGILFINESGEAITVLTATFDTPTVGIDFNGDSTIDEIVALSPFTPIVGPPVSPVILQPGDALEPSVNYDYDPTLYQ